MHAANDNRSRADDPRRLKERQRAEGRTLGQVASELLARALADDVHPVEEVRWTAKAMGARIDLDNADAVRRAAGDR